MVFTPRQPLDLASIGVSSSAPRAVPLDALVAVAERLVDGAVVGRIALVVPLFVAGLAAARLLARAELAGRLAACSFAIWNPYVVERLALGQWALLWSYAALPVVVLAASRGRGVRGWAALTLAVAAASITPTGGLIALATAVATALACRRRGRQLAGIVASAVVLQLPWVVPALVGSAASTSDPGAVAAFAARDEFGGGAVLALLGGGGVWNAEVVPVSRGGALPWLGLIVLAAIAWYGRSRLVALIGGRPAAALAGLAAAGLVIAAASSIPGADAIVRAAVAHVPGAGLLRDAQKWVLPLVALEALLAGAAIDRLARRMHAVNWRAVLLVAAAASPLLLLPDAAAPVHATVSPVRYPSDWATVANRLDDEGGTAVVVPFSSYRAFAWAPGRGSVLDPAPRLLPVSTIVSDRLAVSGRLLAGEDSRAADVASALRSGALPYRLAGLGVRWVVVERDTPGAVPSLAGLRPVSVGSSVALYEVPGPIVELRPTRGRTYSVLAADAIAVSILLAAAGLAAFSRRNRRDPVLPSGQH